jgi:hypothetical protein
VRDPFGNIWWIVAQTEQVSADDMWTRLQDPTCAESMRIAQETLDAELSRAATGRPADKEDRDPRAGETERLVKTATDHLSQTVETRSGLYANSWTSPTKMSIGLMECSEPVPAAPARVRMAS